MNQDNSETTLDEILSAVSDLSTKVDERFDKVENRLTKVETQMVTKSYLDDKKRIFTMEPFPQLMI